MDDKTGPKRRIQVSAIEPFCGFHRLKCIETKYAFCRNIMKRRMSWLLTIGKNGDQQKYKNEAANE